MIEPDLAQQHRPYDRATLRDVARELRGRGLTFLDIAAVLHVSEPAVRELLGEALAQATAALAGETS
jgi:predicted transcriptional regulator